MAQSSKTPQGEVKPLKPVGGMEMWYYRCQRIFRYPIPTDFEFAYIDRTGAVKINGPFDLAYDFCDGSAVVNVGDYKFVDGKWQYVAGDPRTDQSALIGINGEILKLFNLGRLSDSNFSDLGVFQGFVPDADGHYAHQQMQLIDRKGQVAARLPWGEAKDYSEGMVAVHLPDAGAGEELQSFLGNGHWGYCDRAGKCVIKPQFEVVGKFSEGLAAVSIGEPNYSVHSLVPNSYHPYSFSYIEKSGKILIQGPFLEAQPFKNGMAAVMLKGKWGYIDKTGKVVVPCEYDWAGDFGGELAPVEKDLLVGFIDKTGKVVIPFKFKDAREFSGDLAPATFDAKRWGYINAKGDFAIEPSFQKACPFNGDRALVYIDRRKEVVPSATESEYFYRSARAARDQGHINEARSACKLVVDAVPGSHWARSAKHFLLVALPDHDLSDAVHALYAQGMSLVGSGKLDEAEKKYRQAIALDPEFFAATGSLAYVLTTQKRYDEAIELLNKALKKYPSYARGYWRLALVYKEQGKDNLAAENLAKAKSLDSEDTAF